MTKEEIYPLMFKEYAGKCFIRSNKDGQGIFDGSFSLLGQQFISRLVQDKMDARHFVVVGLRFVDAQFLAMQKEQSYEIPYTVKPMLGAYWTFTDQDIDANDLVDEVMNFEDKAKVVRETEIQEKILRTDGNRYLIYNGKNWNQRNKLFIIEICKHIRAEKDRKHEGPPAFQ